MHFDWWLNIIGLIFTALAAALMYFYPPIVTLYTPEGGPVISWTAYPTPKGKHIAMRQRLFSKAAILFLFIGFCLQLASALAPTYSFTKNIEPEGYRVVSYDAATHQWTILRTGTFDGKFLVKRLIVICSSYKWGDHPFIKGPDACHLQVGALIVPNPLPSSQKRSEFLDVFEMPGEVLSITEGDGADRVLQQFDIIKYEVLPTVIN